VHSLHNARTVGFTVLVFCQLFNALNARSAFNHSDSGLPG
jgi:cation transport ATPase-like protein